MTQTTTPYLPGHAYSVCGVHYVALNPTAVEHVRLRPAGDIRGPVTVMSSRDWAEMAAAGQIVRTSEDPPTISSRLAAGIAAAETGDFAALDALVAELRGAS